MMYNPDNKHDPCNSSSQLKTAHFVAFMVDQGVQWFWVGNHGDYDKLIG
jgi:hypothetical protein